jgi:hypothetical protein
MATVTAQISLTSTDLLSDSLSISVSTDVTAANTTGLARRPVTATSVGSGATTLFEASDFNAPAYLYIKNTDSTASDFIYVYDDTTSGDPVILKLAGGDWAFMPLNAGLTLKAYATTDPTLVEFMVIGTDA